MRSIHGLLNQRFIQSKNTLKCVLKAQEDPCALNIMSYSDKIKTPCVVIWIVFWPWEKLRFVPFFHIFLSSASDNSCPVYTAWQAPPLQGYHPLPGMLIAQPPPAHHLYHLLYYLHFRLHVMHYISFRTFILGCFNVSCIIGGTKKHQFLKFKACPI